MVPDATCLDKIMFAELRFSPSFFNPCGPAWLTQLTDQRDIGPDGLEVIKGDPSLPTIPAKSMLRPHNMITRGRGASSRRPRRIALIPCLVFVILVFVIVVIIVGDPE